MMTGAWPEIHAVVEIGVQRTDAWVDLPPEPWPYFVRLSPAATEEEVALVVGTLSCYGRSQDGPARSAEDLVRRFPCVLPGGFAVVGADQSVYPSCCCGLETWQGFVLPLRAWLDTHAGRSAPAIVQKFTDAFVNRTSD